MAECPAVLFGVDLKEGYKSTYETWAGRLCGGMLRRKKNGTFKKKGNAKHK